MCFSCVRFYEEHKFCHISFAFVVVVVVCCRPPSERAHDAIAYWCVCSVVSGRAFFSCFVFLLLTFLCFMLTRNQGHAGVACQRV